MSAGQYNITLEQGSTYRRVFTYQDAADEAIALTGAHIEIRPSKGSTSVLLDITEGNGLTVDHDAGTVTLELDGSALADLAFSSAWYDIKVLDAFGQPDRMLEGRVSISKQVTV